MILIKLIFIISARRRLLNLAMWIGAQLEQNENIKNYENEKTFKTDDGCHEGNSQSRAETHFQFSAGDDKLNDEFGEKIKIKLCAP